MAFSLRDSNILCSPAAYGMDGGRSGSEPLWAHNIVREIAKRATSVTAVTGFIESLALPSNVRVVSTGAHAGDRFMAAPVAARFTLACGFIASRELMLGRYELLHHILPFGLDQTFNPAQILLGRLPLVIGPVQGRGYDVFEHITPGGANMMQGVQPREPLSNRIVALANPFLRTLNHALLDRADAVVASSAEAANYLAARVSPDRLYVIPPGVDTTLFARRANGDPSVLTLLTVGYLLRRKRVDVVLRALRTLLDRGLAVRLLVAGDGPEREPLRELAAKLDLERDIEWLGFVENRLLPAVYRGGDIFVSASAHEGLATVFLEAMSSGLPLVCTNHQGSRAVITDEIRGRIVPQEDPAAMAAAIEEIGRDRQLLEERSDRVRAIAIESYDWDFIGARYADVYASAAARAALR